MNTKFINDIEKDYANYCSQKLREVDPAYPLIGETCIYDYHRYKFRKIPNVKCKIYMNPSIVIASNYINPIEDIKNRIENGRSLLKYQSRKLKDTNYDDGLLMDWGIQHLHLGEEVENDGFVERTRDLLFIRFTHDSAYIVNIFNHNQWTTKVILEVLHKYWPKSIDEHKLEGVTDVSPCPDEGMIKEFRTLGLNYVVELSDGSYYMSPGGGITTANTPMQVTHDVLSLRRIFRDSFHYISKNFKEICVVIKENYNQENITVGLRLEGENLTFYLKEFDKGLFFFNPNELLK